MTGRLRGAGVTEIGFEGEQSHPSALIVNGPALGVVVDVLWSETEAPIVTALRELVDFLQHYGPLIQIHVVSTDMDLVATAARELASRTLVDTNRMLGMAGPPIIVETRTRLPKRRLLEIADLAERQHERFLAEAGRLKMELGVGNAPWPDL